MKRIIILFLLCGWAKVFSGGPFPNGSSGEEYLITEMRLSPQQRQQFLEDWWKARHCSLSERIARISDDSKWSDCLQSESCVGDIIAEVAALLEENVVQVALDFENPSALAWVKKHSKKDILLQSELNRMVMNSASGWATGENMGETCKLLDMGADVNAHNRKESLLNIIIQRYGSSCRISGPDRRGVEQVKLLVETYGANVNGPDYCPSVKSPLYQAVRNSNDGIVRYLLDKGAKPKNGETVLLAVATQSSLFIEWDIESIDQLIMRCQHNFIDIDKTLVVLKNKKENIQKYDAIIALLEKAQKDRE